MKRAYVASAVAVLAAILLQSSPAEAMGRKAAPPSLLKEHEWAVPLEKPGLPNLQKVSDDLYRGAQPTAAGVRELEAMGVKTIVGLRATDTDDDIVEGTKLKVVHISFKPWHVEDKDVIAFLKVVADKDARPVFVHCMQGSDRTGLMVAMYRIVIQGWSKEESLAEMRTGGFGFHEDWTNIIKYIERVNVEDIKRRAGIDGGK